MREVSPAAVPGLASDLDVLAFALAEMNLGRRAALATITSLDGPFSRPLGAQLAIAEDGRFAGSISGGCLERALTEEAVQAMREGRNRQLRYGSGSPYLDVRLPCGGGIDLQVNVHVDRDVLTQAVQLGSARQAFALTFDPDSGVEGMRVQTGDVRPVPGRFVRPFPPRLRILLAGRGWEIVAMTRLARLWDCEVVVASQEPATLDYCRPFADQLIALTTPVHAPPLPLDAHTAVACLFHEHEWEAPLLLDALRSPAFYVGALGSRQTHEVRVRTLRELGAGADDIDRLKGPIGLFPSRDPRNLALSALAEIMSVQSMRTGP
jgi:xanthine dehydrogenase accessory factor